MINDHLALTPLLAFCKQDLFSSTQESLATGNNNLEAIRF